MTKEELDFIGSMNMCDEISNKAYQKIVNHFEETQPSDDCVSREKVHYMITGGKYANEDYEQFIDRLVKELENMQPVTPTFPNGFTNGDIMKIMFPNYKFSNNFGYIDTVLNGRSYSFCPVEFWNAPYKGVEE